MKVLNRGTDFGVYAQKNLIFNNIVYQIAADVFNIQIEACTVFYEHWFQVFSDEYAKTVH